MKPIPWWVVVAAGAAPVLLIGGFLLATAVQPASYNPVRDTISELAGHGATDWWVMTFALVGLGFCYLLVALGLRPAKRVGRTLLAGGGVAVLLIAVFRQPHRGYSLPHELAVIAAALTCCTWAAFAWHRRHPVLLLTPAPCIAAAAVSLGLASWYALESHGALLGIAERCAAAAPPLWLLAVAVSARRALTRCAARHELPSGERYGVNVLLAEHPSRQDRNRDQNRVEQEVSSNRSREDEWRLQGLNVPIGKAGLLPKRPSGRRGGPFQRRSPTRRRSPILWRFWPVGGRSPVHRPRCPKAGERYLIGLRNADRRAQERAEPKRFSIACQWRSAAASS